MIVLIVVLLAVAPLLHFLPSKRQRHQARLREAAAIAGLFVELRDLPVPEVFRERLPAAERQVLFYGCRFTSLRGDPPGSISWFRDGDDWRSQPRGAEPPRWLRSAPEVVLAAAQNTHGCGFYWREEGSEEMVRALAQDLLLWRDELAR